MTTLSDRQIHTLVLDTGMIAPFAHQQVRDIEGHKIVSYGLSSYGYDARLADEFLVPLPWGQSDVCVIDPKAQPQQAFAPDHHRRDDGAFRIPSNTMALARTVERFKIPHDIIAICLGKSTYARCGLIVNVTPLEPGWEGHVTLELSNTTDMSIVVYPGEGIAQFVFFRGERPDVSYGDRNGKYMHQSGIVTARV